MDAFLPLKITAQGMMVQRGRMRVIAENIANANSTAKTAKGQPYRRRLAVFNSKFNRKLGGYEVKLNGIVEDNSPFKQRLEPGHPAANDKGYVKYPNVDTLIETMDMRQAMRSYQANLNAYAIGRGMIMQTIDILKA